MENSAEEEYGNYSFEYYGDEDYEAVCNQGFVKFGSIFVPVCFTIVFLLSLLGNIVFLVLLVTFRSSIMKSFTLIHLAVSDLIFTLGLPFWVSYHIWGWIFGDVMCKVVNYIFFAGYYSSIMFLMVKTIQRYIAILHPLSSRFTKCKVLLPTLAWVVSFSAALPALLYNHAIPDADNPVCVYTSTTAFFLVTYEQNIFFVVAFLIISFCYIRILQRIHRPIRESRHSRKTARRYIFSYVIVFFVCWAPYNTVIFLKSLQHHNIGGFIECDVKNNLNYAFYVCQVLAFSNCCLNPILYNILSINSRDNLKEVLSKNDQKRASKKLDEIRMQEDHV